MQQLSLPDKIRYENKDSLLTLNVSNELLDKFNFFSDLYHLYEKTIVRFS